MSNPRSQVFFVSGVCCSTEEAVVRKTMDHLAGTGGYRFNAVTGELSVQAPVEAAAVAHGLRTGGFGVRSAGELQIDPPFFTRHAEGLWTTLALLFAVAGMAVQYAGGGGTAVKVLLGAGILAGGWRIARKAFGALRAGTMDMNLLMTVAVAGALAIDRWSEAAAVVVLFSVALMLESYSVSRTRRAIRSLMAVAPAQASVLRDGIEVSVAPADVAPGETVVLRPGERVPLDGVVIAGSSSLDQSPITGEAAPVVRRSGDTVYAGSINGPGALQIRTTARYEETTLARIVHLIEEAEHQKAPLQSTVDRFARIYTPAVFAIAVLVATVPPLAGGGTFVVWFYRALVLLVIACPCALVISTPVTIVSALTAAARRGILIKGGKHLETLGRVRAVAFDKTGTLTEGKARVTDILPLNGAAREEIIALISALESKSEHRLAAAITAEAVRTGVASHHLRVEQFEAVPGRGVRATIDGTPYLFGNLELIAEAVRAPGDLAAQLGSLSAEGKTAAVLAGRGEVLAVVAMADSARSRGKEALEALGRLGVRHISMLTGDEEPAARRLAGRLGITRVHAGLLPVEKVGAVHELRRRYGTVAMVGDGINDAPALAASSVGIAMGVGGTDAALETADVVLMSDDLGKLPALFRLGQRAMRIVKQNIALALGLKLVFLVLSIAGMATLWMAVLADDGAAILVIFNGLRALAMKEKPGME